MTIESQRAGLRKSRASPWRRIRTGTILLLLVLAVAHTALWFLVSGRMLQSVPEAAQEAAVYGWRIESMAARRAGWPWRAAIILDGVTISRGGGTTGLRWTTERLEASIPLWSPGTLVLSPKGAQTIQAGAGTAYPVVAARMDVRVPLRGGTTVGTVQELVLHGTGWAADIKAGEVRWDGLAIAMTATGIVPRPAMAPPFDGPADLSVHAVVTKPVPLALTPEASALAWQQSGGRVQVRSVALHLAGLSVEGNGEGGLDAHLQPEGRAELRVTGAPAALDAAAHAGLVAPGPASAARAVLQLLTLGGQGGPVAVPVELRDGVLSALRFPLVRVPAVQWGG